MSRNKPEKMWSLWFDAARREGIDRAIRDLYEAIAVAVAERRPVCNASGRCCKFEQYGHRLYVTGLEIAWFLDRVRGSGSGSGDRARGVAEEAGRFQQGYRLQQLAPDAHLQTPARTSPNCPYQIDGLCSTHAIRPLGCRVFFCEEGTEAWQQETTELFLDRLKQLHVTHDLPYAYMEWRAGLEEATLAMDRSI